MAPPASGSPTALLWAHKLQLENGHLLKRMQKLEDNNKAQEARLLEAENLAHSTKATDVAALAKKVKALDDAGVVHRMAAMESNIDKKLDEAKTGTEAVKIEVAAMRDAQARADGERQTLAAGRDRELLQQIDEVRQGLRHYERSLDLMGRRIDAARFEQIQGRLAGLAEQVRVQGEEMRFLPESIRAMRNSNAELRRAVERNESELKKMAAKVDGGVGAGEKHLRVDVDDEAQLPLKKKKSHKWSGGGADRDIILQGSDLYESAKASNVSLRQGEGKQEKRPSPIIQQVKKRPAPPTQGGTNAVTTEGTATLKKSHHWSGGGADKDIIEAGAMLIPATKRKRSLGDTNTADVPKVAEAAKDSPAIVHATGAKEIVTRTGKGWYEVVYPRDQVPVTKRGRGRPRKANVTPQFTEEDLKTGRSTRRMNYSTQNAAAAATSTISAKRDAQATLPSRREILAIKKEHEDQSMLEPDSVVQDSMAEESQPLPEQPVKQARVHAPTDESGEADTQDEPVSSSPLPPPRVIVQYEDYETFMRRHG